MEKNMKKYVYITASLCYIAETNTALWINRTPIKSLKNNNSVYTKKKKEYEEVKTLRGYSWGWNLAQPPMWPWHILLPLYACFFICKIKIAIMPTALDYGQDTIS